MRHRDWSFAGEDLKRPLEHLDRSLGKGDRPTISIFTLRGIKVGGHISSRSRFPPEPRFSFSGLGYGLSENLPMAESSIEWTDYTFNGWIGCTRVGPGCENCYAAAQDRFRGWTPEGWGAGKPRRRTSESNWKLPLRWNRIAMERGARARVFCSSLADVFDNEVPDEWRLDLATLIKGTPMLDWQLLTKRIGNARCMLEAMFPEGILENVWVGATIVNREELLRDGPKLMATPAYLRFWSAEPLLDDLGELPQDLVPDWVIIGGESGPKARPMELTWAESLLQRCEAAGAKVFMKQLGARPQWRGALYEQSRGKGALMIEWPRGLRIREMPSRMLAS